MANLDTQIERTGKILNDIKEAIEGHGLDLEGVSPVNYSNKIKEIATVSVKEFGIRPVILFKRAETNPGKPIGGRWNIEDNSIEGVDGWYLDLEDDTTVSTTTLRTWMTTALFKTTDGSMFSNWTKPIQISGENGKDGARGEQGPAGQSVGLIQYFTTWVYYPSSNNEIIPSAPSVRYNKELGKLEDLTGGWQFDTKSPDSVTPSNNYIWWQSMLQYNSNSEEVIVTTPVRISAESTAVEGVTRYYLCKSENSIPQINADGWEVWTENSNISPTYEKPYLFVRDSTKYGNTEINSKPWLLAVYTKGLMDIDLSYACLSSNIEITFIDDSGQSQTDVEMNVPQYISEDRWSQTSEAAISKEGYEFTSDYDYLFCRTIYKYHDGKTDCFYQIVSYYKEAEKAPILYSAGIYNEKSIYTKPDSNDQCPYIYYPKGLTLDDNDNVSINGKRYNYFYLKKSQSEEMDFESAYTSGYWKKIDSFEAIYSDIGILKAAEVGNFVFDNKYMFSKFGVDNAGKDSHYTEYSDWNITPTVKEYEWNNSSKLEYETERKGIAAAIEHGAFVPSASINAVTGESWFANGNVKFYSDGEGDLANGAIAWRYDNNEGEKPTLYIDGDVKIGTRAKDHEYGSSTPIDNAKSFNQVISEQEAIRNTFGAVSEIEGVSLSKAVAVKNGNDVTAILDGTGTYNKIGTVVLAAGIDSTDSPLADGINNAKLKIFQSGSLTIGETTDNSSSGKYPVRLGYDGSGHLACGNISWNENGALVYGGSKLIDLSETLKTVVPLEDRDKVIDYNVDVGSNDTVVFYSRVVLFGDNVSPKNLAIHIQNVENMIENREITFIFTGNGFGTKVFDFGTQNTTKFLDRPSFSYIGDAPTTPQIGNTFSNKTRTYSAETNVVTIKMLSKSTAISYK